MSAPRESSAHVWTSWSGPAADDLIRLLSEATLTLHGLVPWSSNYTFLGEVSAGGEQALVIYKPIRGERPLWDFPRGTLAKRETAAYVVSQALGWDLVPPTVLRSKGCPHGLGSVQLFVNADQNAHFFTFRDDPVYRLALQALALFDVIANNADRKGGHCLSIGEGRVVAIDQGLCFSVEPKLRTVIWDFAGEPIPAIRMADLRRLQRELRDEDVPVARQLAELMSRLEVEALRDRIVALLAEGCFPSPPEDRRPYPWPLV